MFRGMTEHEEGDHGFELSLELSIGRSTHDHGKTKKMEGEMKGPFDENVGNLDDVSFAHEKPEGVINGDSFLEEKQFLEPQQFRARARDRVDREREEVFSPEDLFRQNRNGGTNGSVGKGLNMRQAEGLLLSQEGCRDGFVSCCGEIPSSGPVVEKDGTNLFRPVVCGNDSSSCDDYGHQGMPHKGESKSNTRSRSSSLSMHRKPCSSTTGPMQSEPDQGLSSPSKKPRRAESDINCNQAKSNCSTSERRSSLPLKGTSDYKPPMPSVSTTGNGPNGKTITGFLYKYTKDEVSITCVCHGRSFSPAGFVEHAGGIDITHPLKHITVVPSASVSVDKC